MSPNEQTEEVKPAFRTCPIGFLVHQDGHVDANRGCGYRKCYESACNWLKTIKEPERCD